MSLLSRFRGLFAAKAVQQVTPREYVWGDKLDSLIEHAILGSTKITPSRAMEFYRQSSIVATVVDIIARKAQCIPPVIDRGGDLNDEDPILDLLAKPNDFETYRQWMGTTTRNYLLTGNMYQLASGLPDGPPKEIYALHPINVAPYSTVQDGYPEAYDISGLLANGRYQREPIPGQPNGIRFIDDSGLWQLHHFKGYTTRVNQLTGDSPLEAVIIEIRQHMLGSEHNAAALSNGARLSMMFSIKEDLPESTFREVEKALIERYGGAKRAGAIGVVAASEMEVHEFGQNNKDMEYNALMEMVRTSVLARYGVPLPLVVTARQTFSNYAEAIIALFDDAVIPLLDEVFDALTDLLFPRFGRNPRQERLTYNPWMIAALRERIINEVKGMGESGVFTMNELRGRVPDLEDIEGGDFVFGPATNVPMAGDGIDQGAMMLEDREAAQEAAEIANEAMRQGGQGQGGDDE